MQYATESGTFQAIALDPETIPSSPWRNAASSRIERWRLLSMGALLILGLAPYSLHTMGMIFWGRFSFVVCLAACGGFLAGWLICIRRELALMRQSGDLLTDLPDLTDPRPPFESGRYPPPL